MKGRCCCGSPSSASPAQRWRCGSGGCPSGPPRRRSARRRRSHWASTPFWCSPRTRSRGWCRHRPDGMGLNPLLQDPGLAFHPPTLYIGYVGLSVAFSFAVGALVTRDVGPAFARAMRPWVLGAWIFLTIGITAGSYWAYYELGWGGWWFWDPVENASLMPWLAATALLHSVTVLATRDGFTRLDRHARGGRLLDEHGRHVPRPLGHPDQRSRLRGRPPARCIHPGAAGALHRRGAGPVRDARRHGARGVAVRLRQPRRRAGRQQPSAVRHPWHRSDRHALPARRRRVRGAAVGRRPVLRQGGRACGAGAGARHGGRPAACAGGATTARRCSSGC